MKPNQMKLILLTLVCSLRVTGSNLKPSPLKMPSIGLPLVATVLFNLL